MTTFPRRLRHLPQLAGMLLALLVDALRYLGLCLRPSAALAAENLFLRKQLALYQERHIKPKRATHATRIALLWLARWFDWWQALAMVQPATFIRRSCECSSTGWPVTTHREVRSGLPTNCS
jgi:hypothetical protein